MTTTPEKTDLVNVTIDGVSVSVPKGTLVIRAAEQIGVEIPRFCDHPLLKPVGACRQCLVEVWLPGRPGPDGTPGPAMQMQGPPGRMKPQASCTLECSEGMEVRTQVSSEGADKAQQGIMEFLLVNHPLDCPVCDKGGECPLQNQAMSHGRGDTRFDGHKRTFPKPININAQVLLDRERCVLCARCTRFSEQIAGDPFIALVERGALQQVGIYEKQPFESYFAGNTIQICPVGALTSADYRFRSRPFDLVSTPAVGEHDACGAAIRVDHRRGKVMRRLSGNDPEVNEEWITDKDRFAFHYDRTPDRLSFPQVRDTDTGELRAASWPEAFAVAARGLAAAGPAAVLPGGRLTAEEAYAYAKFARVSLGTNDIDFRARPTSPEETAFLAAHVVLRGPDGEEAGVTYADLERAKTVVLAGLEPEDEAGSIFLRLRKANRAGTTSVIAISPYTSRGSQKLRARVIPTAPGDEAAALAALAIDSEAGLGADSVVLLGDRLATSPGAYAAAVKLAESTGARLAWVPRRAGDRGAVEAGCLPTLLPGGRPVSDAAARVDVAASWGVETLPDQAGRSTEAILALLAQGDLGGVVFGGVDLDDLADPAAARAAVSAAKFVVCLEQRETELTRMADVVFPVATVSEKSGMFVNWEGRIRSFETIFTNPQALPDVRVLAGIAEELGKPIGFRTPAEVRSDMEALGPWEGARADVPLTAKAPARKRLAKGSMQLATWKQMLDHGTMQSGEAYLAATARPAVARLSEADLAALGNPEAVTVTGPRGSLTLPAAAADLPEGVVWVPANNMGRGVLAALAGPGDAVTVAAETVKGGH
jgi:NADH-quinone oxidoreductase subunit G